jgi:uroporphyrinogen III methyltransferase/synthase
VNARPLSGKSVAITRASESGNELQATLTDLGADVVSIPIIATGAPPDAGAALVAACNGLTVGDTVAVTSVNGAKALQRVPGPPVAVRVVAVGPATAEVLDETPWAVDLVATKHTAIDLARELGSPHGSGRLLYVAAAEPRPGFSDTLIAAGWTVQHVTAYRTVLVRPEAAAIEAACATDAIVFTSGSTVRGWLSAAAISVTPLVVSMGPSTSAVARELGLKVDSEASDQTIQGLAAAVVEALSAP